MFVPLYDKNSLNDIKFQYMTVILIAINVGVFLYSHTDLLLPSDLATMTSFALVPLQLLQEGLFGPMEVSVQYDAIPIAERWTLLTYMFLHGGWMHLIGNMLFLWVFGDNVEDAMGHFPFLIFYLLCGVAGGLMHTYLLPESEVPLVGASGAVAGVVAAYLMLHPRVQLWVLVLSRFPLPISAGLALGAWAVFQFANAFMSQDSNVAWWAHVGGLIAGAVLILFMRRPGVPLFDRTPLELS